MPRNASICSVVEGDRDSGTGLWYDASHTFCYKTRWTQYVLHCITWLVRWVHKAYIFSQVTWHRPHTDDITHALFSLLWFLWLYIYILEKYLNTFHYTAIAVGKVASAGNRSSFLAPWSSAWIFSLQVWTIKLLFSWLIMLITKIWWHFWKKHVY